MRKGRFITFEGGEGAGKSTQIRRLAAALRAGHAREVVVTREPGGTPLAERLRAIILGGKARDLGDFGEALLFSAARIDHIDRIIRPALARGAYVLCDRFADSTLAYQGYGHGLAIETIEALTRLAVGAFTPDLTLVLDLPVDQGLRRAGGRGGAEDRYERMDSAFHDRLRQGFLVIARAHPERCAVIDAAGDPDSVHAAIRASVAGRLGIPR